jgi:opacity protein-like surface antigen
MKALIATLLVGAFAAPVSAQSPLSLEVTGDGAMPTEKLGGAKLHNGFGFGMNVRYRVVPGVAAYGGWEWHHSRSDELRAGRTTDVEDTGYTFGIRIDHALTPLVGGWARAGGLYNHVELEDRDGALVADSKHGLGWELGGGLSVPITRRVALTPGVRYRSLTRDLQIGDATRSSTLSYVTLGTGIVVGF